MLAGLVRKELVALLRDPHGLAALFAMPLLFIVVMSLALQDVYSPATRVVRYAIVAHDDGPAAQALLRMWRQKHGEPQALPDDWASAVRTGDLGYVLVLHKGLSAELIEPWLPARAYLQLVAEPGSDHHLLQSLRGELSGVAGEVKARAALARNGLPAPAPGSGMQALVQVERLAGSGPRPTAVQHNVPAWLVFGMFFVVASLANLFVQERDSGILARLRSLGVPNRVLLASKALPYLAVNALQAALMLAVGAWLMPLIGGQALSLAGIDWGALLLALGAISLAAVGMGLALACLVRTHAQAAAVGPIVNLLLAAVGGIMVPKFVMPAFMQKVAELSPMNWALEILLTVLLRSGDLASVVPPALRLAGFAAVMFALAIVLFRRSLR